MSQITLTTSTTNQNWQEKPAVSSWILTSCHLHRVTSGSNHTFKKNSHQSRKILSHQSKAQVTKTTLKTNHPSTYQCTITRFSTNLYFTGTRHEQEPAWITCDYQQGDPFYSMGPHRKVCKPKLMQIKCWERVFKNEGEWTGKVENRTNKKFLAVGEACMGIFWPTPAFTEKILVSSGFSRDRTLISASTVPHCG